MKNIIEVPPKAGALCESIRGMGYSLSTAVSDIVDNSVAARAKRIDVRFRFGTEDAEPMIEIRDDGEGMTREELINAMSLGSLSPLERRRADDLGRFGLGLKTASFSQCRRLTVTSRRNGMTSSFVWDIDRLSETNRWDLMEKPGDEAQIKGASGTVVRWTSIDKLPWMKAGAARAEGLAALKDLEKWLGLTFHRFLEDGDFTLTLNSRAVHPWDPFYADNPGSPRTYPEVLWPESRRPAVRMRQFLIPPAEYRGRQQKDFGLDDDMDLQGFFLYRGKRLISHGGWLGLKDLRRGREFCLARIRVEFMNDADAEWQIDIRKSIARPPRELRPWLQKYAVWTRTASECAFQTTGRRSGHAGRREASMWLKRRNSVPRPDSSDPVVMAVNEALVKGGVEMDVIQGWSEILAICHPSAVEKASCQARSRQVDRAVEFICAALSDKFGDDEARSILMSRSPFSDWDALMTAIFEKGK